MARFDVVFSGGGTKGIAFAGALEVLENSGHSIGRLVGCSAGAITASLIAVGYRSAEMVKFAQAEGNGQGIFATFLTPPAPESLAESIRKADSETRVLLRAFLRAAIDKAIDTLAAKRPTIAITLKTALALSKGDLYDTVFDAIMQPRNELFKAMAPLVSFLEFGGFYSADQFTGFLLRCFQAKLPQITASTTLSEFHQLTGRDLSVVAADTSDRQALILNHRTAPFCPLVQAVHMSMSVPLVWSEVVWPAEWGKYLGRAKTGHILVDGAAMLNFPVRYLADSQAADVRAVMGEAPLGSVPLGILLDEQLPVPGEVAPPSPPSKVVERLGRLIDTARRWEDDAIRPHDPIICRIPSLGYSAMEFRPSVERVETLINAGRCAMIEHLKRRG